ncbi:MAG: chemotaxis response regulator protein-glutamate methylesterase [Spirochaetes bacterium]|nr:chemotaxis response regulator protein-glutamate methylesterase [Spirochaetota bacterium]
MNKIKVLIVDDSAVVRKVLSEALSGSDYIEVAGTALDPIIASEKIKKLRPDVITLDIEMPRMDGITFLEKLMKSDPIPVIMVSSFTDSHAELTMKALSLGAFDFILKPNLDNQSKFETFSEELIEKVIGASRSKFRKLNKTPAVEMSLPAVNKKFSADIILPKRPNTKTNLNSESVIAIGASTGGTEVIVEIISSLPENTPGIIIAQHMPEKFTKSFADRVNSIARLKVKEAEDGDRVMRGSVFIAPGGKHMLLKKKTNGYYVEINDGPPVNRHKPSVDVLFRSFAQSASHNSLGIILTGMGDDGARGLLEIREAGIPTIAQDEASCVIFGMPAEAIKLGAAAAVKNIECIISEIKRMAASIVPV